MLNRWSSHGTMGGMEVPKSQKAKTAQTIANPSQNPRRIDLFGSTASPLVALASNEESGPDCRENTAIKNAAASPVTTPPESTCFAEIKNWPTKTAKKANKPVSVWFLANQIIIERADDLAAPCALR